MSDRAIEEGIIIFGMFLKYGAAATMMIGCITKALLDVTGEPKPGS